MNKYLGVFAGLLLLWAAGCSDEKISQAEDAATGVAEKWLILVDSGQYQECWEQASKFFQDSVPLDQWLKAMESLRIPMGKNIARKVASTSYRTTLHRAPEGEYVVIKIEAQFENKASTNEMITLMLEADGKWRVAGYYLK